MNETRQKTAATMKVCLVGAGRMGMMRLQLLHESRKTECVAVVETDRTHPLWKAPETLAHLFPPPLCVETAAQRAANEAAAAAAAAAAGQNPGAARPMSPEKKQGRRSGGVAVFGSLAEVTEKYDAVWVSTPTDQHAAVIEEAAKRTKFIFCEAPLAHTEAAIKHCYSLCQERGVELICGWYSRFDKGFQDLYDRTQGNHVTSTTIIDKRGLPYPKGPQYDSGNEADDDDDGTKASAGAADTQDTEGSAAAAAGAAESGKEAGRSLGPLFREYMCHDFNLALMFMNEKMPTSVQATMRDTYGDGTYDSAWCTLEFSNSKSVFIELSMYGPEKFESSVRMVVDGKTEMSGKTDVTREQEAGTLARFQDALRSELVYFVRRFLNEKVQLRTGAEQCVATVQLAELAEQSAAVGAKIPVSVGPVMKFVQVGGGSIARYLRERVLPSLSFCELAGTVEVPEGPQAPLGLPLDLLLAPQLERAEVDSVHVCLPYKTQTEAVELCLRSGKKILCQPPVFDLHRLQKIAIERDCLLMLDFPRRFDRQFQRAKEYLTQLATDSGVTKSVLIEKILPAPPSNVPAAPFDVTEMLWNQCIHDIDLLSWLFEDVDCEMSVRSVTADAVARTITMVVPVWLRKFDSTIDVQLSFAAHGRALVDHVVINDQSFGHDLRSNSSSSSTSSAAAKATATTTAPAAESIYDDAYERELKFFASQPGNVIGQGKYCLTYSRAFRLVNQALDAIHEEETESACATADSKSASLWGALSRGAGPQSLRAPVVGDRGDVRAMVQEAAARAAEQVIMQQGNAAEFRGVAGHGGMFKQDGKIYKPLVYEENEWTIYETIRKHLPELLPWVPRIYERTLVHGSPFLVMEDLTYGYEKPVVMDLKVGEPSDFFRMHNQPYAMKVAGYTGDSTIRRSQQSWGDLQSYFRDFIRDRESANSRYEVLPDFIEQLEQLLDIFSRQTLLRMRAVSILFVYDSTDNGPQKPSVRILDLARAKIMQNLPDVECDSDSDSDESKGVAASGSASGSASASPSPAPGVTPDRIASAPPTSASDAVAAVCRQGSPSGTEQAAAAAASTAATAAAGAPQKKYSIRAKLGPDPDTIDHFFSFGIENTIKLLKEIHQKFVARHAVFLCRHAMKEEEDGDLSLEGMQQAYDMAARLKHENISVIVSSPHRRAIQTAKLIAEQLAIKYVVEPLMTDLIVSPDQAQSYAPLFQFNNVRGGSSDEEDDSGLRDRHYVPVSSFASAEDNMPQTLPALQHRVYSALSTICKKYKRVAIVGHASSFVAMLSVLVGQQWQGTLHFASITILVPNSTSPVGWSLERMNMRSHLTTAFDDYGRTKKKSAAPAGPARCTVGEQPRRHRHTEEIESDDDPILPSY